MVTPNSMSIPFDDQATFWLFGYGSLIYKVDFPWLERRPGRIFNWSRRFWQGSHDHRGTPDKPGRVVTLIKTPGAVCEGMAYRITAQEFAHLDHREKNGYVRLVTDVYFQDATQATGVVYIAAPDNRAYLGPATEQEIARHIADCAGPSGENSDYLLQLAHALRELNEVDEHVFTIERHLLALRSGA